jgi:hypothetical protein
MSEGAQARGGAESSLPGGELHPSASRDEQASVADAGAAALARIKQTAAAAGRIGSARSQPPAQPPPGVRGRGYHRAAVAHAPEANAL